MNTSPYSGSRRYMKSRGRCPWLALFNESNNRQVVDAASKYKIRKTNYAKCIILGISGPTNRRHKTMKVKYNRLVRCQVLAFSIRPRDSTKMRKQSNKSRKTSRANTFDCVSTRFFKQKLIESRRIKKSHS